MAAHCKYGSSGSERVRESRLNAISSNLNLFQQKQNSTEMYYLKYVKEVNPRSTHKQRMWNRAEFKHEGQLPKLYDVDFYAMAQKV